MADGASGNGVVTSGAVATQPLGSLIDRGYRPREPANDDEVWSLNLDQIEPHSGRVHSKCMLSATELGPSTYAFDRGTVLYSKLRPYLNKVVVADDDGVATTELVPLRCDESRLIAPYLAHFLRGPDFLRFATNVVAGAKMPRMVMSEFWKFPVPLPPLPEQRRIAAILDQADALRAKRRDALAQLDSLTQSIFVEMFGDPRRLPLSWPLAPLKALGLVRPRPRRECSAAQCHSSHRAISKSMNLQSALSPRKALLKSIQSEPAHHLCAASARSAKWEWPKFGAPSINR